MKMRYAAALAAFLSATLCLARAEFYLGDVHGVPGKLGASDQKDFTVLLVDTVSAKLVHGILTVDAHFGDIETAALMVYDKTNKKIVEVAILPEDLETGKRDFEFHLSRELLPNSFIAVSHRDKNDFYIAKVLLGTFTVVDKSKH